MVAFGRMLSADNAGKPSSGYVGFSELHSVNWQLQEDASNTMQTEERLLKRNMTLSDELSLIIVPNVSGH